MVASEKRTRKELEEPAMPLITLNEVEEINQHRETNKEKENIAYKLNNLKDKLARYDSHKSFLTRCFQEKIIPNALLIDVEPSIGNHDEDFLA